MATRRLLIDSVVMVLVAATLAVIGWVSADPLLRRALAASGADQLTFAGPGDVAWWASAYPATVALAFTLPALSAWLAALLERAITKDAPPWPSLALYWLLPAAGVLIAIATRLRDLAILGEDLALAGMEPTLDLDAIDLGPHALEWGATFSVVMWIVVGFVAPGRARLARRA